MLLLLTLFNIVNADLWRWYLQNELINDISFENNLILDINLSFNKWETFIDIDFEQTKIKSIADVIIKITQSTHLCGIDEDTYLSFKNNEFAHASIGKHYNNRYKRYIAYIHLSENVLNSNFIGILTHEIGHNLELRHINNRNSIMYYHDVGNTNLDKDDITKAIKNYGKKNISKPILHIIIVIENDNVYIKHYYFTFT